MKIKHFLLGAAIVALMAACGGKQQPAAEETATETPVVEETVVEEIQETVAEEPVAETKAPETKKSTTTSTKQTTTTKQETKPAVDPCEAKVKAFEKWVDQIKEAKKNKGNGAVELKAWLDLKKQAATMESSIAECKSNPDYKTRIANAVIAGKKAQETK